VASAPVTVQGIVGDQQKTLKYHGGPDRALGLWSLGRYRRTGVIALANHPSAMISFTITKEAL